jgi:quinol monooxygenase YgiN
MIIIAGTMTMDPAHRDEFLAAAQGAMEGTHAEEGNREYVFSADPINAGVVRLFEIWDDASNLGAHMGAEHMKTFGRAIKHMAVERDLAIYNVAGEPTKL